MRVLRGSQTHGLAGMAAVRETAGVRLLRPLLGMEPPSLCGTLLTAAASAGSKTRRTSDQRALRPRLRHSPRAPHADWSGGRACGRRATAASGRTPDRCRTGAPRHDPPGGICAAVPGQDRRPALRSLSRRSGAELYPPAPGQLAGLAADMKPATVAGVRILPAGRFGDGMLIVREEAAIAAPFQAANGAIWDRRFRVIARDGVPHAATIGKLGDDAAQFRRRSPLPSVILRTLPVIRIGERLAFVRISAIGVGKMTCRSTCCSALQFRPPALPSCRRPARRAQKWLAGCYWPQLCGRSWPGGDVGIDPTHYVIAVSLGRTSARKAWRPEDLAPHWGRPHRTENVSKVI